MDDDFKLRQELRQSTGASNQVIAVIVQLGRANCDGLAEWALPNMLTSTI